MAYPTPKWKFLVLMSLDTKIVCLVEKKKGDYYIINGVGICMATRALYITIAATLR